MSAPTTVMAIEWGAGVSNAWSAVATFIPALVMFLIVLFVGWIIAKVVSGLIGKILQKVGFENLIERAGIGQYFRSSSFTPTSILCKLIYYFILLIALQIALTAFGSQNPVSQILNNIVLWLPQLMVAVVIIVVVAAIATAVKNILDGVLGGLSYGALLSKIVAAFIIGLGVIAALNQIGVAPTVTMPILIATLATIAGVIIVGVGGGLIAPMRSRWEGWLNQMAADSQAAKDRPSQGGHQAGEPGQGDAQPYT